MAVDNAKIAEGVLAAIGGADNIVSATHCMTRLRLTPKDKTKIDDDAIKAVKGFQGFTFNYSLFYPFFINIVFSIKLIYFIWQVHVAHHKMTNANIEHPMP